MALASARVRADLDAGAKQAVQSRGLRNVHIVLKTLSGKSNVLVNISMESFDGSEMDDCDFVFGSVLLLGVSLLSSRFSSLVTLVLTVE